MKAKTTPLWLHQHGAEVINTVKKLDALAEQGFILRAASINTWSVKLRGIGDTSQVYKGKYQHADAFLKELQTLVATDVSQNVPPGLSAKDVINHLKTIEASDTRVISMTIPE